MIAIDHGWTAGFGPQQSQNGSAMLKLLKLRGGGIAWCATPPFRHWNGEMVLGQQCDNSSASVKRSPRICQKFMAPSTGCTCKAGSRKDQRKELQSRRKHVLLLRGVLLWVHVEYIGVQSLIFNCTCTGNVWSIYSNKHPYRIHIVKGQSIIQIMPFNLLLYPWDPLRSHGDLNAYNMHIKLYNTVHISSSEVVSIETQKASR